MQNNITWCLNKNNVVHWADWENNDESVIYFESTGETALVSLLSLILLEAISSKPQTLNSLTTTISNLTEESIEEHELLTAINSSLAQLKQFDVIEPCQH